MLTNRFPGSKSLVVALLGLLALMSVPVRTAVAQKEAVGPIPIIPVGKENDVKLYAVDGA